MIAFTLCGTNPTGPCDGPLISIPLVVKGGVQNVIKNGQVHGERMKEIHP